METKEIKSFEELKEFMPLRWRFWQIMVFLFLQVCLLKGLCWLWTSFVDPLVAKIMLVILVWIVGSFVLSLICSGWKTIFFPWDRYGFGDYWKRNVIGYRLFCKWSGAPDEKVTFEVAPWNSEALHCRENYIVLSLGGWFRKSDLATYKQSSLVWSIQRHEIKDGLSIWMSIKNYGGDVYNAPLINIFRFLDELAEIPAGKDMDFYIFICRKELNEKNGLVKELVRTLYSIIEEIENGKSTNRPLCKTKGGRIIQDMAITALLDLDTGILPEFERAKCSEILDKLRPKSEAECPSA